MFDDKLRDEIIETQKAQNDLTKWKLFLVAGIGAAALGMLPGGRDLKHPGMLLSLIPLACIFVDIICYHLGIRILKIACFIRCRRLPDRQALTEHTNAQSMQDYEIYCSKNRQFFSLEGYALLIVTLLLSLGVVGVGQFSRVQDALGICRGRCSYDEALVLTVSGTGGLVLAVVFFGLYKSRSRLIAHAELDNEWQLIAKAKSAEQESQEAPNRNVVPGDAPVASEAIKIKVRKKVAAKPPAPGTNGPLLS